MQIDKILGPINHKHKSRDIVGLTTTSTLTEYTNSDPASPANGEMWLKKTVPVPDGVAGEPRGLLLALTYAGATVANTYEFSVKTVSDGIKRVAIA